MKKIEQVSCNNIIIDYDEKLYPKDILNILNKDFKVLNKKNPYICNINGQEILLFVKQITYLGHPHLPYKKRIQIPSNWEELKNKNAFVIGIYKYKTTVIYTHFDKTNYIQRKTNNSSAHVSTFDLLKSQNINIATKKDAQGNIITTIKQSFIKEFFNKLVNKQNTLSEEVLLFQKFKNNLDKNLYGRNCYLEMFKTKYNNMNQSEWVGSFVEYKFEEFLSKNSQYNQICIFQKNKSKQEIDLDLNFNNKFLGDLKTHSESSDILGNDENNIKKALELYNKLWYIVFSHNTIKDKDKNYVVTKFWNKALNKDNSMSYANRMKYSISFVDLKILEINNYNKSYLNIFNQGHNSNGLPRKPKIKINKKDINNFLIYKDLF